MLAIIKAWREKEHIVMSLKDNERKSYVLIPKLEEKNLCFFFNSLFFFRVNEHA